MERLHPKEYTGQAASLARAHDAAQKRTVLLYTGVTVAVTIAASALSFLLDHQISGTGGLGGLGMRSLLQTLQTALSYALSLFSPFWQGGFLLCMVKLARDREPEARDMLAGFRRLIPLLSCQLWRIGIGLLASFVTMQIASILFAFMPFSDSLILALEPYMADPTLIETVDISALLPMVAPALAIYAAITLPVLLFLEYGMRLAPYLIMDDPRFRSLSAILASFAAMKGHRWELFRLDLRWWWFYALETVLAGICYLDVLLPMMGLPLPFHATAAYFLFFILYGVLELALHWWKKGQVEIGYALAYDRFIRPVLDAANQPPQTPQPNEFE